MIRKVFGYQVLTFISLVRGEWEKKSVLRDILRLLSKLREWKLVQHTRDRGDV